MPPPAKTQSRPVFKTEVPFTETNWPEISSKDQDIILDLLCNLLEPIGHHRQTHIHPSKGKKRKRTPKISQNETQEDELPPPMPEINNHILVGLNSVTRHLSELAARTAPTCMPAAQKRPQGHDEEETSHVPLEPSEHSRREGDERHEKYTKETKQNLRSLSVVVIPHPSPSSSLAHAHIPTLLYLSSLPPRTSGKPPPASPTPARLVTLPTSSETRLASTLHIPRIGALGILEGAPGADALITYVRDCVGFVECKWVEEGLKADWKGAKISSS